ncbi:MAG: AAA family ATPase [Patescibacteria group bacterium]
MNFETEIAAKMVSRSGHILVLTQDEKRLEKKIQAVARSMRDMKVYVWSTTGGLRPVGEAMKPGGGDPGTLIQEIDQIARPAVVVCYDYCSVFNAMPNAVVLARQMKDYTERMKVAPADEFAQIVICDRKGPDIPFGLTEVEFPVPGRDEMRRLLLSLTEVFSVPTDFDVEKTVNCLLGFSAIEAENAIAESISATGKIDTAALVGFKRRMVNAAGLEWVDPDPRGMAGIGGLENLKRWAIEAKVGFDPVKAKEYDLAAPCGIIMAGVPGTGKSATAKALAGEWGFALVRYNGGAMSKYVGESEANFKAVLRKAEAVAPAILFIDEAEKVFASGGGETDGGASERIAGEFLTWLQEKTAPVFVVMTANNPKALRAELLRAGRIDMKFWLDVPNRAERLSILDVFTRKYRKAQGIDRDAVADASKGWTGAEIESAIKASLRKCMISGEEVTTALVLAALRETPKVAESFAKVKELREWATAACMPASLPDDQPEVAPRRQLGVF